MCLEIHLKILFSKWIIYFGNYSDWIIPDIKKFKGKVVEKNDCKLLCKYRHSFLTPGIHYENKNVWWICSDIENVIIKIVVYKYF